MNASMKFVPRNLAGLLLLVASLALPGCGGSSIDKVVVSGKASYAGVPIENGEIRFYPQAGTKGPVSGAAIANGRYEAKAKGGVPVGTHRVEIIGYRPPSGAPAVSDEAAELPGGGGGAPEQYVAAKFNEQSTLELVVEPTANTMEKDFDLQP